MYRYILVEKDSGKILVATNSIMTPNNDTQTLVDLEGKEDSLEAGIHKYKYDKDTETFYLTPESKKLEEDRKKLEEYTVSQTIKDTRSFLFKVADDIISRNESEKALVAAGLLEKTTDTDEKILSWHIYKQELRDVVNTGDPLTIVWPTTPT